MDTLSRRVETGAHSIYTRMEPPLFSYSPTESIQSAAELGLGFIVTMISFSALKTSILSQITLHLWLGPMCQVFPQCLLHPWLKIFPLSQLLENYYYLFLNTWTPGGEEQGGGVALLCFFGLALVLVSLGCRGREALMVQTQNMFQPLPRDRVPHPLLLQIVFTVSSELKGLLPLPQGLRSLGQEQRKILKKNCAFLQRLLLHC